MLRANKLQLFCWIGFQGRRRKDQDVAEDFGDQLGPGLQTRVQLLPGVLRQRPRSPLPGRNGGTERHRNLKIIVH